MGRRLDRVCGDLRKARHPRLDLRTGADHFGLIDSEKPTRIGYKMRFQRSTWIVRDGTAELLRAPRSLPLIRSPASSQT